jgi:hypothetical protein
MHAVHTISGANLGIVPDWYFSPDPRQNPHINPFIGPPLAGLGLLTPMASSTLKILAVGAGVVGAVFVASKAKNIFFPRRRRR